MHVAVKHGSIEVSELLLNFFLEEKFLEILQQQDDKGENLFHLAAEDDYTGLVSVCDIGEADQVKWEIEYHADSIVKLFLENFSKEICLTLLQQTDNEGNTPLHVAAIHKCMSPETSILTLTKKPSSQQKKILWNNYYMAVQQQPLISEKKYKQVT